MEQEPFKHESESRFNDIRSKLCNEFLHSECISHQRQPNHCNNNAFTICNSNITNNTIFSIINHSSVWRYCETHKLFHNNNIPPTQLSNVNSDNKNGTIPTDNIEVYIFKCIVVHCFKYICVQQPDGCRITTVTNGQPSYTLIDDVNTIGIKISDTILGTWDKPKGILYI